MKKINGVNVSVEVVPVLRQDACVGAFAILQRYHDMEVRQDELRKQLLHKGHYAKYDFDDIVGNSPAILHAKEILRRMAASESPVLLIGETGTGKELFAHALHQASRRKKEPFVAINVAAFPENLLESELFGYEEGAFTGAKKGGRPGLLETAHKGTLFLDEVEGMSPMLQVKLLRVLQERELMRVGGSRVISIDVRIVAATNESLEQKVDEGSFRRDLYYRLNTLPIMIPPLCQRDDDLFLLIDRFNEELGGNIRELRNVVEYFIYTGHGQITMEDLPPTVFRHKLPKLRPVLAASASAVQMPDGRRTDTGSREDFLAPDDVGRYSGPDALEHAGRYDIPDNIGRYRPDLSRTEVFWFVLGELYTASEEGSFIGREKLLAKARKLHIPTSQQEIRAALTEMSEKGLVRVSRGRGGSRLTPEGRSLWETRRR